MAHTRHDRGQNGCISVDADLTQREQARLPEAQLAEIFRLHGLFRNSRPGGRRAVLTGVDLSGMNLAGEDLSHADFTSASFYGADLAGCRFDCATLFACDFRQANLENASLIRADLLFGTACLDTASGDVIWKRDDLHCRHYRGPSSSLVLYRDLVILTMDGVDVQYHAALDKLTGKTVWKTDRSVAWNDENTTDRMIKEGDRRKAHSTPLIVTAAGKPQMLSVGAKAAYSYDPLTGQELWRVQFDDWSSAPRPIFDQGLAFIVTGLGKTEMWALRTDGSGDVTSTNVVQETQAAHRQILLAHRGGWFDLHRRRREFYHLPEAATGQVVLDRAHRWQI